MKKVSAVLLLILFLLNIIPLFLFKDKISFFQYSIPPLILMLFVIMHGVLALIYKHKGNFFAIRKHEDLLFAEDKDDTFTSEYDKKFTLSCLIYFAPVPFYLPLIFFSKNWTQTLFSGLLLAIPQTIFILQEMIEFAKDVKADKIKKQQLEQELRAQQQREELGHWK